MYGQGEVIQAGLETSNASGENAQTQIPRYAPNSVQQGIINAADGYTNAQQELINSADGALNIGGAKIITEKPQITSIPATSIFGFTPKEAGIGAIGVLAVAGVIAFIV